jgi:hypothetical protein
VYIASSLSQVNSNKAIVSILNSTEEAMEIRDLKVTARNWNEEFEMRKVTSQIPETLNSHSSVG